VTAPAGSPRARRTSNPWRVIRYCRLLQLEPQVVTCDEDGRPRRVGKVPQKAMLMILASYADPDGTGARPAMARLAADVGTDERTARRTVRALELGGHLVTLLGGRFGENGRRANRYRILIRPDVEAAQLTAGADDEPTPAAADVRGGVTPPAAGGGAPPTCQVPRGNPQTPGDPPGFDDARRPLRGAGPPGCAAHKARRLGCPDCLDQRRAGWSPGCGRHRRRRTGCTDCATARPSPGPVTAPCPQGRDGCQPWKPGCDCECRHGRPGGSPATCALCRSVAAGAALAALDGPGEGCPVCGHDEPTAPRDGRPCARCAPVVAPPPPAAGAAGAAHQGAS